MIAAILQVDWTPGRILFVLRHPAIARRHFRAVACPWPEA